MLQACAIAIPLEIASEHAKQERDAMIHQNIFHCRHVELSMGTNNNETLETDTHSSFGHLTLILAAQQLSR